jgi:hypothetical protein
MFSFFGVLQQPFSLPSPQSFTMSTDPNLKLRGAKSASAKRIGFILQQNEVAPVLQAWAHSLWFSPVQFLENMGNVVVEKKYIPAWNVSLRATFHYQLESSQTDTTMTTQQLVQSYNIYIPACGFASQSSANTSTDPNALVTAFAQLQPWPYIPK